MKISREIFWDTNYDTIDWEKSAEWIICREYEMLQLPGISLKNKASYVLFFFMKGVKIDIMNYPYKFIAHPVAIYHSLLYFEDAEKQENPVLLNNKKMSWEKVKQRIITETRKIL